MPHCRYVCIMWVLEPAALTRSWEFGRTQHGCNLLAIQLAKCFSALVKPMQAMHADHGWLKDQHSMCSAADIHIPSG